MMMFIVILLITFGFVFLSLSLSKHYSQITDNRQRLSKRSVQILRLCGFSLLILGGIIAVIHWGLTLGLVYWCAIAMLVALVLSLIFTFKPKMLSFFSDLFS